MKVGTGVLLSVVSPSTQHSAGHTADAQGHARSRWARAALWGELAPDVLRCAHVSQLGSSTCGHVNMCVMPWGMCECVCECVCM